MKKRIISWLLVFCMVLGIAPVNVFATEVTNQAPTVLAEDSSFDMKLNEWHDVDMTACFEDADGEAMTYYVTYDGETWDEIKDPAFRFYPNGTGKQTATFKAVDESGNESETFTITANVAKPPNKVTVNFSVTQGENKIYTASETDKVMVPTSLTVPYFDLALYGLDRYYYNPQCYETADGNIGSGTAGTKDTANNIVTVMHVFIYATEVLYLGYDTSEAGTGASYKSGDFQNAILWNDQSAGSSFVFLWDHGTNLNYYIDWAYPIGAPRWGATSDQIALYGGEDISIHMIEDTSAHGSDFAFFTTDGTQEPASQADTATIMQGNSITLTSVLTEADYEEFTTKYKAHAGMSVYWCKEDDLSGDMSDDSVWSNAGFGSDALKTDENGQIILDTTDMEPGNYYIATEGIYDQNVGTETGAALIKLTVEAKPTDYKVTVTQNDNDVTVTNTGNIYSKGYVYFAELPEFGAFTIDDDADVALRYITTGRQSVPFAASVNQLTSTKEAIEGKYGTIEGLDSENTLLQVYEVCQVSGYRGKGAVMYTLIVEVPIIRVSSITLDETAIEVEGGTEVQLTAMVAPENASYPKVTWTSSNTASVEVDANGLLKTYDKGEAVITATADGMSASCTVTVTKDYPRPTVVFSGTWPYGTPGIGKVSVTEQATTNTLVNGSKYFVTMDANRCADNAVIKLVLNYSANDRNPLFIHINDEINEEAYTASGTKTIELPLVDGFAMIKIAADGYSLGSARGEKTFYFSTKGQFPVAPLLAGGASGSTLVAEGDTYSLELSPLFNNISDKEMTYTVAIDDGEAVAAEEAYSYVCDTPGTHKLVFTANNTYGDSPVYTATVNVIPETAIYRMNRDTENGGIAWFAFTDDKGNAIEGTTVTFDEETKTFDIELPMDIVLNSKVNTYYIAKGTSFFTGSNQTAGASQWSGAIRKQHTNTLTNGKVSTSIYFYDVKPTHANNNYETYKFNYHRLLPEGYFEYEITDVPKNKGGWDYETKKIMISGDDGAVETHQWNTNRILHVALGEETPDDAIVSATFSGTGSFSGHGPVTLVEGEATLNVTNISTMGNFWGTCGWTVNYKKDKVPAFVEGVEGIVDETVPCLDTYTLDLSTLFVDADEDDTLTYEVRVDGGDWTAVEDPTAYTFVPEVAKPYTLEFRAYDGFVYSKDIYTVNITSTNSTILYDATVNNLPKGAEFYCNIGYNEDGTPIDGEGILTKRDTITGSYAIQIPKNVTTINIKCGDASITATASPDNETNVINLAKVTFELQTLAGNPATGTVVVTYGDGYKATGNGFEYYLVPGDGYTYTATPDADFSVSWLPITLEAQTVTKDETVVMQFGVKAAKAITIDADAELNVYYQRGYYIIDDIEPALVKDNGDGTITYTYSCTTGSGYSRGYMYFATKGDLIDKVGYLMGVDETTITWEGEEKTSSYRGEYDPSVGQGSRGDDSILVNVNSQNHLILDEGETFRLRSFRIWEVISTDTENCMLEPQFTYTGYDENIISMVSANEAFKAAGKNQLCGTGGNNWMDLTVEGKGVTFLEVGYEAMHMINGYTAGGWGGASGAPEDFVWNAIDPARTALIVVQTDGNAATDVDFGIECFSSNVSGNYYAPSNSVSWDAEFDTVYFLGEKGEIRFAPTAEKGKIASVEISSDKGATWTTVPADKGFYTADIFPGNNIIRVTKEDGTTAYQVVRGDKISVDVSLVTDVNEDGEVDPGDTVRVTYDGLHNPIGKMSGIYNPGFGQGQRVTYTWEGANVRQSGYYQYDFITNAWIEVTIPEDSVNGYTLKDGYINFNVFGDGPGNHRNLTDGGRSINTSAASSKYTRSILPDIELYTPIYENGVDGKNWPNYNAYIDSIKVAGVSVEAYETKDDLIYVALDENTADDAQFSLFVTSNVENDKLGLYTAKIDGEEASVGTVTLENGLGTINVTGKYLGKRTKTIIFSKNYKTAETAATCGEAGYTTYTFEDGVTIKVETTPATGEHVYDEGVVTTEPTCGAEGVKTYTCIMCDATETEAIPATGEHVYDEGVVTTEPTCVDEGVMTYTCACGDTKTEAIPATGEHVYGEGVVTTEPTCVDEGVMTYTCVCGETKTEAIPATGEHTWDEGVVTTEAACEKDGVKTYTCTVCDATKTEAIRETDEHVWDEGEVVTKPTCVEKGMTIFTCETCGATKMKVVPATGEHVYDEGVVTTEPTLTEEGVKTYTCACGETKTEAIPALGAELAEAELETAEKLGLTAEGAKDILTFAAANNISTDLLYVTEETITTQNSEDVEAATFGMLSARAAVTKATKITLKWNKVKGADGYLIYGNKCGTKNKYKQIKVLSSNKTTFTQSKRKAGTYYKYLVVAYKLVDGKKVTIAASKTIHAVTTSSKYCNAKSVKVSKTKVTVKKGKTYTIKASQVKASKNKKIKKHRKIAFESSNKKIATVTKNGKIKGIKKGTCYIYVYAQNGVYKRVKVTVK